MSGDPLILALPSTGRLMEHAGEMFEAARLTIRTTVHTRDYLVEADTVASPEIAHSSFAIAEAATLARKSRTYKNHAIGIITFLGNDRFMG